MNIQYNNYIKPGKIKEIPCKMKTYSHDFNNKIIIIQSVIRRFLVINRNKKPKDNMNFIILKMLIEKYNEKYIFNNEINKMLSNKKLRNENFPSEISENIVKFALYKKYGIFGTWDTLCGDLMLLDKKIEVKGFMSDGPASFGPTEKWDWIYFVDARQTLNEIYTVYEFKISNVNNIWQNLKMNKNETYNEQCNQKRRPRITFKELIKQLNGIYSIIFDGHIDNLYSNE